MRGLFTKLTKDVFLEKGLDENGIPPGDIEDNSKYIYDTAGKAQLVEYGPVKFNETPSVTAGFKFTDGEENTKRGVLYEKKNKLRKMKEMQEQKRRQQEELALSQRTEEVDSKRQGNEVSKTNDGGDDNRSENFANKSTAQPSSFDTKPNFDNLVKSMLMKDVAWKQNQELELKEQGDGGIDMNLFKTDNQRPESVGCQVNLTIDDPSSKGKRITKKSKVIDDRRRMTTKDYELMNKDIDIM
jgi:hypothetical protein